MVPSVSKAIICDLKRFREFLGIVPDSLSFTYTKTASLVVVVMLWAPHTANSTTSEIYQKISKFPLTKYHSAPIKVSPHVATQHDSTLNQDHNRQRENSDRFFRFRSSQKNFLKSLKNVGKDM